MTMDEAARPAPRGEIPPPARPAASVPGAAPGAAYDAAYVRAFLHRRVLFEIRRSKYRHADAGVIDDLTHRAWLGFDRAQARPIQNLEGLLTVIARRQVITYINAQMARDKRIVPIGPEPEPPGGFASSPAPEPEAFAVAERLARIALQIFERDRPHCVKLWSFWKDKIPWETAAGQLGESADALKQRWSRSCLKYVRELLEKDARLMEELGLG